MKIFEPSLGVLAVSGFRLEALPCLYVKYASTSHSASQLNPGST